MTAIQTPGYRRVVVKAWSRLPTVVCIVVGLTFLTVPTVISAQSARKLNSAGFRLYKQGKFEEAIKKFRGAVKADSGYALGHYNLAATMALLRNKYPCQYEAGEILEHLAEAVSLDKRRRKRMRKDSDFDSVRETFQYQIINGLSLGKSSHVRKILMNVEEWFGPSPGVRGPMGKIIFMDNKSVSVGWYVPVDDDGRGGGLEFKDGTYKVNRNDVRIEVGGETYTGLLDDNGTLDMDGLPGPFGDSAEECGL